MTKLPSLSDQDLIHALRNAGFAYAPKKGKGSHTALFRIDEGRIKRLVIIPKRKIIPKGTLNSILKQAGLSKEELIKMLK